MKRGRKTPGAPPPPGIAGEAVAAAKEKLTGDYLGFVNDTATEDPKHFVARSAAAREALEHLAQLRELAGEDASDDAADAGPSTDDVLVAARAGIADENKK
jgi:hypothetical protein